MRLRTEAFGGGDTSWLDSAHGTDHGLTASGSVNSFTDGTHIKDGVLLSGVEVNIADRADLKPWTGAAGEVLGYVLFNVAVSGADRFAASIYSHGRVRTSRLPLDHIEASGGDASAFVFNTGGDQ